MKRNPYLVERRRDFIRKQLESLGDKSMKEFVIDLSDKIFISESTIWKDIRSIRRKTTFSVKSLKP